MTRSPRQGALSLPNRGGVLSLACARGFCARRATSGLLLPILPILLLAFTLLPDRVGRSLPR
eukprot:14971500-Alexandrium_andersonii.AAC.1